MKSHTQTGTHILISRISHQLTVGRHNKTTFENAIICNSRAINTTFVVYKIIFLLVVSERCQFKFLGYRGGVVLQDFSVKINANKKHTI